MTQYLAGATNYVLNPSFVSGFTYWVAANGALTYDATQYWAGTTSGKLATTAANAYVRTPNSSADPNRLLLPAGANWAAAFRICGAAGKLACVEIVYYSAAGASLGTYTGATKAVTAAGSGWTLVKSEGEVAPASCAFVEFRCKITNSASGESYYIDGADFRQSETINTYVDGTQGAAYGWTGTPHQSTSYRLAQTISSPVGDGGYISIVPKMFRADRWNNLSDEITQYVLSGTVEMQSSRDIKMAFTGTTNDPTFLARYSDYFAPFLTITLADGTTYSEQLGLFSIPPMAENITQVSRVGTFTGYDLTWNLSQSTFSGAYSVAAGSVYTSKIVEIIEGEGFTRHAIPVSTKTLATAITWKQDDSKLKIINDLLTAIGYYPLFVTRQGVFQSFAIQDLSTVEPAITLASGDYSTLVGAIKRTPTSDPPYNFVKVWKDDSQNAANSIYYEQENSSLTSPTSTVNLKRRITLAINDTNLESLAVAKTRAAQALQNAASLYTSYEVQTLPDPRRSVYEVYDTDIAMNDGTLILSGKVRVDSWKLGFTPRDCVMTHVVYRLEDF